MSSQKKPLCVVIVGPNASGKSALAIQLAKKFNGEIISADSRQIYRGMDIGTGKIRQKEMRGIQHYGISVASPKSPYSVAQFQTLAAHAIRSIIAKKKVPIVCGGTGFWIDAAVSGQILPAVKPNVRLRRKLRTYSLTRLFALLRKLDPQRASTIDKHNPRRLMRAIEIASAIGNVPPIKRENPYRLIWIGVTHPLPTLHKRIKTRLNSRFKQGMIAEVARLHCQGVSWKRMNEFGLEYRYIALYLRGKITKPEMIEMLEKEIRRYAKRQLTWFKRNHEIFWINSSSQAIRLIRSALHPSR